LKATYEIAVSGFNYWTYAYFACLDSSRFSGDIPK
jgi:hypothetical protein